MAVLNIPEKKFSTKNPQEIREFLNERGVIYEQWEASIPLTKTSNWLKSCKKNKTIASISEAILVILY